jgi:hypothetical protein
MDLKIFSLCLNSMDLHCSAVRSFFIVLRYIVSVYGQFCNAGRWFYFYYVLLICN